MAPLKVPKDKTIYAQVYSTNWFWIRFELGRVALPASALGLRHENGPTKPSADSQTRLPAHGFG